MARYDEESGPDDIDEEEKPIEEEVSEDQCPECGYEYGSGRHPRHCITQENDPYGGDGPDD